jgi:hypothetical protein
MSLVGSLEDLGLGDILQIVSLSRKSGLLVLRSDAGEGRIVLHDGQVRAAFVKGRLRICRSVGRRGLSRRGFDAARERARERVVARRARERRRSGQRVDSLRREHVERAWAHVHLARGSSQARRAEATSSSPTGTTPSTDDEARGCADERAPASPPPRGSSRDRGRRASRTRSRSSAAKSRTGGAVVAGGSVRRFLLDAARRRWCRHRAWRRALGPSLRRRAAASLPASGAASLSIDRFPGPRAKSALAAERIHIFQRSDRGGSHPPISRAERPLVLLSTRAGGDPLSGAPDAAELVRRLKLLAPQMAILWLKDRGAESPIGGEAADGVVARPPVYGVQFHPEKSGPDGLALLGNFARLCAA